MVILGLGVYLRLWGVDTGRVTNVGGERDQIWSTVTGLSIAAWDSLLPLFWVTGFAFLAGGSAATFLAMRGQRPAVLICTAVTMLGVLAMAGRGMGVLEDYFSHKKVSLLINRIAPVDATVICYGATTNSPSLLYYLDREVYWLDADARGEFASRELGINRALFLSKESFVQRWASATPVVLCIEENEWETLRSDLVVPAGRFEPVARFGTTLLLTNRSFVQ